MKRKQRASSVQMSSKKQQPYDNVLKSLIEGHEREVLPFFWQGARYLQTLNIEALRTPLRLDRVYKVRYGRRIYILHIEFESKFSKKMPARLLDYHAYLYRKYGYPVISIIVYPFSTKVAVSPLRVWCGEREILTFHFYVLPLCECDAEHYVRERALHLYALLPTMKGATAPLLLQALDEMVEYYQDNEEELVQQLKWFSVLLRRANMVSSEDMQKVEERLDMWDNLLEQDPYIKKKTAQAQAKGLAEGRTKGLQDAVVRVARVRFPRLVAMTRQRVQNIEKIDELEELHDQLVLASDEIAARTLLNSPSA